MSAANRRSWGIGTAGWIICAVAGIWIGVSGCWMYRLLSEYRICPGYLESAELENVPSNWQELVPACREEEGSIGPFRVWIAYPWGKAAALRLLIADPELCSGGTLDATQAFAEAQSQYLPRNAFADVRDLRLRRVPKSGLLVLSLVRPDETGEELVVAFRQVQQEARMLDGPQTMFKLRLLTLVHGLDTLLFGALVLALRGYGNRRPGRRPIHGVAQSLLVAVLLGLGLVSATWVVRHSMQRDTQPPAPRSLSSCVP